MEGFQRDFNSGNKLITQQWSRRRKYLNRRLETGDEYARQPCASIQWVSAVLLPSPESWSCIVLRLHYTGSHARCKRAHETALFGRQHNDTMDTRHTCFPWSRSRTRQTSHSDHSATGCSHSERQYRRNQGSHPLSKWAE